MKNIPSFLSVIALALIHIFSPTAELSAQTLNDNGSTYTINANGSEQRLGSAQDYTIPSNTSYNSISFTLRGGDGGYAEAGTSDGDPCKSNGGAGATTEALFWIGNGTNELKPGGTIRFIVGKHGENDVVGGSANAAGSGGGGTAVLYRPNSTADWTILAVAGGGGGAHQGNAFFSCLDSQKGQGGRASENGGNGEGTNAGSGGANGNGGGGGTHVFNHGDGGGGAYSDGDGAGNDPLYIGGGAGYPDGGNGVNQGGNDGGYGFGGGGGAGANGGGGGGGYSGGGGGATFNNGGGGGSYVNSSYDLSSTKTDGALGGGNSQNGHVDYTFISTEVVWTGAVDHNWHNSSNWSPGKVPSSNDIVYIPAAANIPYVWTTADAREVQVFSGGNLTLQPNSTLNLYPNNANGISNFGTITNNAGEINIARYNGSSNNDGILNQGGTFINKSGGVINIEGLDRYGIFNDFFASFINEAGGTIHIGTESSQISGTGIVNKSGSFFTNFGILNIRNINSDGIESSSNFTNTANGLIKISQTAGAGIKCVGSTFTNDGEIRMGENGNIGNIGVHTISPAIFRNNATSTLSIWQSNSFGVFVQENSTLENFGDVTVGGLGGGGILGDVAIVVLGSFTNKQGGEIFIDQTALVAILNGSPGYLGVFNNEGNIAIGSVASTGGDGIQNQGTFNNTSTGSIDIVRTGGNGNGIYNANGSFTNSGLLKIGENGSIANAAIRNGAGATTPDFSNSSCSALIHIFDKSIIDAGNSFTNSNTILQESTGDSNIETNNGIILYNAGTFTADNGNAPVSFSGSLLNRKIWTGCASNDWATAENWASPGAPTASSYVTINPTANNPVIAAATAAQAEFIVMEPGANLTNNGSLTVTDGSFLVPTGSTLAGNGTYFFPRNFLVNGTFIPGTSTVTMNGIDPVGIYSPNGPLDFYTLVIDKPSDVSTSINANVTVTNDLDINSGILNISSGSSLTTTYFLPFNPGAGTSLINNGTLTVSGLGFGIPTNVSVQGDGEYIFSGTTSSISLIGGTFNPGTSTVIFSGTGTQSISSGFNLYKLVIDKPSGNAQLGGNITVANELNMVSGNLDLRAKELELIGNGAIIGEGPSSYIYGIPPPPFTGFGGVVKKTVDLDDPTAANPGNIGVSITSPANLGSTTIQRGHDVQQVNGEASILRYYDISPANNTGLDATVRFSYFDHELNGLVEGELSPYRFTGTDWDFYAASARDATANWVETQNVDAFSKWTLATACDFTTYYADADGDGYGDPMVSGLFCDAPDGYVLDNTDCDDSNAASFPGNPEICDGIDNNCNGTVDEGLSGLTYVGSVTFSDQSEIDAWPGCYTSITGNLLFDNGSSITDLSPLTNLTSVGGSLQVFNCDALPDLDGLENITSVGGEITISNNDNLVQVDALNGLSSVVGDLTIFNNSNLANLDGLVHITSIGGEMNISFNSQLTDLDGLSNVTSVANRLDIVNNAVLSDCCGIHYLLETPGAVGNTILIANNDTGCDSETEVVTYCVDADNDGFSMNDGDCDDGNADVNPGITEICNGIDDNCDGQVDEGFDLDGDGYTICEGDCNDTDANVNPSPDCSTITRIWTGHISTDWEEACNWSPNCVPTADDDVTIPNVANNPVISGSTAAVAKSVTVNNGSVLAILAGGSLAINGSTSTALTLNGEVENYGTIEIGTSVGIGWAGMLIKGSFFNRSGANLTIENTSGSGISGTSNSPQFLNESGATISIGQAGGQGLHIKDASFINEGELTISQITERGFYQIGGTFLNGACGTFYLSGLLHKTNSGGSFSNSGLFVVNTSDTHINNGLTNNGILAYPQGNPIPNVTNNEIIIAPTATTDCASVSPAFSLGATVDFNILGIFTDADATQSAGTYDVTTNAFTPANALAQGTTVFYVKIEDPVGGCTRTVEWTVNNTENCNGLNISGTITWEHDGVSGVNNATVNVTGAGNGSDASDTNGDYAVNIPSGTGNFTVKPVKNINKLNGVTSADITAIQQHVANIAPLPAPFKRIAADVNKSNSITAFDASLLNQALLGNPSAMNLITSWRFVPESYVFSNPNAPWGFPEQINLSDISGSVSGQDFKGIKLGDVVSTWANPANFSAGEPLVLRVQDRFCNQVSHLMWNSAPINLTT
ncbi:MAG: MopE-related protein [Saprospiraceae bacterium]